MTHCFYIGKKTPTKNTIKLQFLGLKIMVLFLNLFILTRCETRACLDAHKADNLGGIEGEKQVHLPFKTHSLHSEMLLLF